MKKIEEKGGLYVYAARLFADDETNGSFFIAECFEQCHNISALELWGPDLVLEITHFRLEMIRHELRMIVTQPGNLHF